MSNKIYVIDTNVLLYAGKQALVSFEENEVVLPFVVIEELEKKRLEDGLVGAMARFALHEIEKLRKLGKLKDGVEVNPQGGILRVEMNHRNKETLPEGFADDRSNDTRVLTVAHNLYLEEREKALQGEEPRQVILVSNDLPLRIKADAAFQMKIEPFWFKGNLYPGLKTIQLDEKSIAGIYQNHNGIEAPATAIKQANGANNHAFVIESLSNPNNKCFATLSGGRLRKANDKISPLGAVTGKSIEQKVALNYLYDDSKKIVSLGGKAGTGKTLLSVVSAMEQVAERQKEGKHQFGKLVVIRPLYAVGGQDIGHLPGTEAEKMEPWKKAIYDSVEGLIDSGITEKLEEENKFDVMPATFLRGRTFHNCFTIVDEAQNFEPSVLLTILSRIGHNSKIVFLWDATQKDNQSIGYNDGIVSVVEKLKGYDEFAHISLMKSERSHVAEIAGSILEDYLS